jgi:hypothetical protein
MDDFSILLREHSRQTQEAAMHQPLTMADFLELMPEIQEFVERKIMERVNLVMDVVEEHAVLLEEIRQRGALEYRGVWSAEEVYQKGNFTTDAGSVWCCMVPTTTARPGFNLDWKLAVKRGRDSDHARSNEMRERKRMASERPPAGEATPR